MDRLAAMRVSDTHFFLCSRAECCPLRRHSSRAGEHEQAQNCAPNDPCSNSQRGNPYSQQDNSYELSDVKDSTTNLTAGGGGVDPGDMSAFYAEVRVLSYIRE